MHACVPRVLQGLGISLAYHPKLRRPIFSSRPPPDFTNSQQAKEWHDIVTLSFTQDCAVRHDKIYALLGLVDEHQRIEVDYSVSKADLFLRVLVKLLNGHMQPSNEQSRDEQLESFNIALDRLAGDLYLSVETGKLLDYFTELQDFGFSKDFILDHSPLWLCTKADVQRGDRVDWDSRFNILLYFILWRLMIFEFGFLRPNELWLHFLELVPAAKLPPPPIPDPDRRLVFRRHLKHFLDERSVDWKSESENFSKVALLKRGWLKSLHKQIPPWDLVEEATIFLCFDAFHWWKWADESSKHYYMYKGDCHRGTR